MQTNQPGGLFRKNKNNSDIGTTPYFGCCQGVVGLSNVWDARGDSSRSPVLLFDAFSDILATFFVQVSLR